MEKTISPKSIAVTFGALTIIFLAAFYAIAWTEPPYGGTCTNPPCPPGGNAPAPVNVSATSQTMTGTLTAPNLYLNTGYGEGSIYNADIIQGYNDLRFYGNSGKDAPIYLEGNPVVINNDAGTGNVGIGTTTPGSKLHVFASSGNIDTKIESDAGDTYFISDSGSSYSAGLLIKEAGVNKWSLVNDGSTDKLHVQGDGGSGDRFVTVEQTGRVGIGTANPVYKLDVQNGQINASGGLCIAGTCKRAWDTVTNYWAASGNNISNNNTGNVGIGNNSPIGPLAVGNSAVDGSDGFVVIGKKIGGGTRHFRIGFDSNFDFVIGDYGYNNVAGAWVKAFNMDWNTPDNTLVLNNTGNVGIGTPDPGIYKLKVDGTGNITGNTDIGGNLTVGGRGAFSGAAEWDNFVTTKTKYGDTIGIGGDNGGDDTEIRINSPTERNNVVLWNSNLSERANLYAGKGNFTGDLSVTGNVAATKFYGDGSTLTGIAQSQWSNCTGGICYQNGNVGIGTPAPGYKLDVKETGNTGTAVINVNQDNATKLWTGTRLARQGVEKWFIGMNADADNDKLRFRSGNTSLTDRDVMVVDYTTGNLSVGGNIVLSDTKTIDGIDLSISAATWNAKEDPLTFSTPLSRTANAISIPAASATQNGYLVSTDWTIFNNKLSSDGIITGLVQSTASGDSYFTGGNVGIGTTDPQGKLEVSKTGVVGAGRLRISDIDTSENPEIQLKYNTGVNDHWAFYVSKGDGNKLTIWQGSNLLTVDTSGNLTVGGNIILSTAGATVDGVNLGNVLTSESDPKVGTLTSGKWCTTNGSVINCATDAPTFSEADAIIGNEVTDAADATLTRSGAGTAVDPYKLKINLNNANAWTGAQTFSDQTWNGNITWNDGKNINVSGESSFDVKNGGTWGVWDTANSRYFIQAPYNSALSLMPSGGSVGIGTAGPITTLNIYKNVTGGLPLEDGTQPDAPFRIGMGSVRMDFGALANGNQWIQTGWIGNGLGQFPLLLNPIGGNVGIGTTAPGGKLEVNMANNNNYLRVNNDNNIGLELRSGTTGGTPYIDFSNDPTTDYDMRLSLAGDDILAIEGGKVGIGTTGPEEKLHIYDGSLRIDGTATQNWQGRIKSWGSLAFIPDTDNSGDDDIVFYSSNAVSEIMRVAATGNVGIGTTAPGIKLAIGDTDTGLQWINDGNLGIYTNNSERIRIDNNGNVEIKGTGNLTVGGNADIDSWAHSNMVTNLNADMLDGNHASAFLKPGDVKIKYGTIANAYGVTIPPPTGFLTSECSFSVWYGPDDSLAGMNKYRKPNCTVTTVSPEWIVDCYFVDDNTSWTGPNAGYTMMCIKGAAAQKVDY